MNIAASPSLADLVRFPSASNVWSNPKLNRIARHPGMRLLLLMIQADQQFQADMLPGNQIIIGLLNHPTAQEIILSENLLLGDDPVYNWDSGQWITGDQLTSGKYGISISADERIAALEDILSHAAGRPIDASTITAEEALDILDGYNREEASDEAKSERTAENVSVAARTETDPPDPCDELCEIACACMNDRGGARTYQECVAQELRDRHYDGRRPQSPDADGPRPEVSYKPNANGSYEPVMSQSNPEYPTSAPVVRGAPRPDISWWKDGKLWKIFEMKFPGDTHTTAQSEGAYEEIADHLDADFQELDVGEDCDCNTGKAKPGAC